jgi:hypothetical protein
VISDKTNLPFVVLSFYLLGFKEASKRLQRGFKEASKRLQRGFKEASKELIKIMKFLI